MLFIKRHITSSFAVQAVLLFTLLAALNYSPVFAGKVPLPVDSILNFPIWESIRGPQAIRSAHAELGDLVTIIYPWRVFAAESLKQGVVPLWNPHVLLGAPFLADLQSSVFYPLNAVYHIFPAHIGWILTLLLRIILAGVFAAMFARQLGISRVGSLSAGIIFTFSGFMICWQGWTVADSGLWMPAVCLCVERLRRRLSISSAALTGVAFAMPVLAGHPQTALYVILTGTAYATYRLFLKSSGQEEARNQRGRYVLLFTMAGLSALALAAVQILPTGEWLGYINRTLEVTGWGSRPLSEAVGFLSRDAKSNPSSVGIAIPEGATYSGILTLLAASLAILHRKKADVIFFLLLLVCALQVVYGFGPVFWIVKNAPVFRALPSWRMILIANFSLALLAGFGISAVEEYVRARPGKRLQAAWWSLLCVSVAGSVFGLVELYDRTGSGDKTIGWLYHPQSSLILLLLSAAILSPWIIRFMPMKAFAVLIPLVVIIDLVSFSYGHIPFFPREQVYPVPRIYEQLKAKDSSLYRVVTLDKTSPVNLEVLYGFYSPAGYDFIMSRTQNFLSPYIQSAVDTTFLSEKVVKSKSRLLDLMNVKYLVATNQNKSSSVLFAQPDRYRFVLGDSSVQVFENLSALPRAFLVPASGIQVIPNEGVLLDRLASPTFDPTKTALLNEMPDGFDARQALLDAQPEMAVSSIRQGINDVKVTTQANVPAILVLSDTYYPGWKVFVDGREEKLLRVDYAFKGVALQPGAHDVGFSFQPGSFRAGWLISALSSVILIAAVVMRNRNRKDAG